MATNTLDFTEAEPFENKRTGPRRPVPDAISKALKQSFDTGKPLQKVMPTEAGAKELKLTLERGARHLGYGIRTEIEPSGKEFRVRFLAKPKQTRESGE